MQKLRPELQRVYAQLRAQSAVSGKVELDTIGHALGTLSVSTDEIDALVSALERDGREIVGPTGGGTEAQLKQVVSAARALKAELARRPTLREVAQRAGLSPEQVLIALALLRVMQR